MSKPTLGVMAIYWSNRRFEEMSYFQKLAVLGQKLGLEVMVFSPEDANADKRKINGLFYDPDKKSWYRKWSDFPDIVYDRCRNQATPKFRQLREFRDKYPDLVYLNRPLANKLIIYQVLSKNKDIRPHLPFTVRFTDFAELSRLLRKKNPLYLKPINGTGGRGILRIYRSSDSRCIIQGRDGSRRIIRNQMVTDRQMAVKLRTWSLQEKYLVQQGIDLTLPNGRVHDFRLLMQKNGEGEWTATGCAGRIGPKRSVTSNLHGGGVAVPMERLLRQRFNSEERVDEIKLTMERLGRNVVEYLEHCYGKLVELGLDLAVDPQGRVWLLEINPKPSREVFRRIGETSTYNQAISRPLEYALWVNNHRKDKP